MTPEQILDSLNPEQRAAAAAVAGPVLVLAGAGTGKTRVITYRIAYMLATGIAPEAILGMTFTNKAAREMRERLAALVDPKIAEKVTLGTFHAFCVRLLRREIRHLGYLPGFTIADESDQQGLYRQAAAELGYEGKCQSLPGLKAQISRWKNALWTADDARKNAEGPMEEAAAALYTAYQRLLELQNQVDFDDLLLLTWRVLEEFPETRAKYRERYRYLLIDEYQDTNDAQFSIVKLLAGDPPNLCVVGDDDQSIYSWRGANIENILAFPDRFPGTRVVKLEQNYRSTGKILEAANAVIAGGGGERHAKRLWSALGDGEEALCIPLADGEAEARFVAAMIQREMADHRELQYSDFAILYRSNHLSREFESALRAAALPYRLVGGQEFYQRKEIKDAVAYLKLLVNPRDDQSLLRILGLPPRGLGETAVASLKKRHLASHRPMVELLDDPEFRSTLSAKAKTGAAELDGALKRGAEAFRTPGGLARKIRAYLEDVGYWGGLQKIYKDFDDAEKRRDNVGEFLSAVAQFELRREEPLSLEAYLESFALLEENDRTADDDGNTVTLCSIHAAKGLEFPVVFLVALELGGFPHERAVAEGSIDEERRLFYVAITRARRQLYLLFARRRMTRGMIEQRHPSPFLGLLPVGPVRNAAPEEFNVAATAEETYAAFSRFFTKKRR